MEDVMQIFEEIDSLLTQLDEVSVDLSYLERLGNAEHILAVAFLARGVIRGDLEITDISIDKVEETKTTLGNILSELTEDDEDDF
jgi:hypothetical protein